MGLETNERHFYEFSYENLLEMRLLLVFFISKYLPLIAWGVSFLDSALQLIIAFILLEY